MLDTVLRTLGGMLNNMDEAANGRRKQQKADDTDAAITKHYETELNKAAETGDWQYVYANEEELQKRIPQAIFQSLISKTKLNNARQFQQQMDAGEQPTIPLSPGNMAGISKPIQYPFMGGPSVPVNPLQAVMQTQMDPGVEPPETGVLQGIPNGEPSLRVPGVANLYRQPGAPQPQEAAISPPTTAASTEEPSDPAEEKLTVGPMIQQLRDANASLAKTRDEMGGIYPQYAEGQPSTQPATPPTIAQTPAVPAKQAAPDFVFPTDRQAKNSSSVVHTPIGPRTLSRSQTALTGPEVTGSLLSQADEMGKTPDEAFAYFNRENNKRLQDGKPTFEWDHQQMNAANARHWDKTRAGIQDYLESQLNYPREVAQRESAIMASRKLQFTPSQYTSLVNPSESDVANGAFNNAVKTASIQIDSLLEGMQAPLKSTRPSVLLNDVFTKPFLKQAIDSVPGANLQPAARTAALHTLANTAHSAFFTAIQQARPDLTRFQQNYFAMSMASRAVGGDVPEQWRAFVEQDPVKLGLLTQDNLPYWQSMPEKIRPDLLDPDSNQRVQDHRTAIEQSRDRAKQYEQAMRGVIKTPEGQTAFNQMLTNQTNGQAAGPGKGKAITPATIGRQDRAIQLGQEGAQKQQAADIERKNAVIPTGHLEKLQTADGIYKAAVEAQQLSKAPDKNGQTLIDKYGSMPGSWREFAEKYFKQGIGKGDPQLASYMNRLSKVYNFERHELTGAATSLYEGESLIPYLPGPSDNIKTGLRKLNSLTVQMRDQLDQKLDQAKSDYPRSNHDVFFRNKQRTQEAKDKAANDQSMNDILGEARKRMKP